MAGHHGVRGRIRRRPRRPRRRDPSPPLDSPVTLDEMIDTLETPIRDALTEAGRPDLAEHVVELVEAIRPLARNGEAVARELLIAMVPGGERRFRERVVRYAIRHRI